jgi:hypothetical protein
MKKPLVVFIVWLVWANWPTCGVPPLPGRYVDYSVSVEIGGSSGTGFFLQASNSVYLVTARHVLFSLNPQTNWTFRASDAKCVFFSSDTYLQNSITLNLNILTGQGDVRFSTNHDIAMVRFEDCNPTNVALVS